MAQILPSNVHPASGARSQFLPVKSRVRAQTVKGTGLATRAQNSNLSAKLIRKLKISSAMILGRQRLTNETIRKHSKVTDEVGPSTSSVRI